jgi:hypothetical protein
MTLLTWAGTKQWRAESAAVRRTADGCTARGVPLNIDPLPLRSRAVGAGQRLARLCARWTTAPEPG